MFESQGPAAWARADSARLRAWGLLIIARAVLVLRVPLVTRIIGPGKGTLAVVLTCIPADFLGLHLKSSVPTGAFPPSKMS